MKKNVFLVLFSLLWFNITAQTLETEGQFPGQTTTNAIKYTFPDTVNCLLYKYMALDTNLVYFIEIYEMSKYVNLRLYSLPLTEFLDANPIDLYCHITSSNRYCLVNNKSVPVVLQTDLLYSNIWWEIYGEALLIRLKREAPGKFIFITSKLINVY